MKILITGDFVLDRGFGNLEITQTLISLFKKSDLNIVNLEAPVTDSESKIIKTGPHLKVKQENVKNVLKELNVKVLSLANNHILDYDEQGVKDTLSFCRKNNLEVVGAGMNLEEASKSLYIDTAEGKVAIINFAENEWASATDKSAGANPMDIIENVKQIRQAKKQAEFVFVIIHGGHEYYNLPSPRMQKQYRFYAENGADLIVGHHTHCISGNEVYRGVPIYYSLGNFLFTKFSTYDDWYVGLVLQIEIIKGQLITQLYPVKQERETFKLGIVDDKEKEIILNRVLNYNNIIKELPKLQHSWNSYTESQFSNYLNYLSPISFIQNRLLKAALIKSGIKLNNKKGIALFLNLMRCEAHADMCKDVAKKYLSQ